MSRKGRVIRTRERRQNKQTAELNLINGAYTYTKHIQNHVKLTLVLKKRNICNIKYSNTVLAVDTFSVAAGSAI